MKYFILFLLSANVLAQNSLQCPTESFLIEFVSPITGGKKSFCGYQKDGVTVKHGPEWSFDRSGVITSRTNHVHGVVSTEASVAPIAHGGYSIPGTEEAVAGKEVKILSSITELMQILTLKKRNSGQGMFKVQTCDARPADWLKAAIFNTPIQRSYAFNEKCDVAGSFSANFKQEFPMQFTLRNLHDFTKTNLNVRMSLKKSLNVFRYRFEVLEGSISAPTRNADFKVEYEVNIDTMTGEPDMSSQQGKITLTKVDGKEATGEASLRYDD
jgi:hypothetical protein